MHMPTLSLLHPCSRSGLRDILSTIYLLVFSHNTCLPNLLKSCSLHHTGTTLLALLRLQESGDAGVHLLDGGTSLASLWQSRASLAGGSSFLASIAQLHALGVHCGGGIRLVQGASACAQQLACAWHLVDLLCTVAVICDFLLQGATCSSTRRAAWVTRVKYKNRTVVTLRTTVHNIPCTNM